MRGDLSTVDGTTASVDGPVLGGSGLCVREGIEALSPGETEDGLGVGEAGIRPVVDREEGLTTKNPTLSSGLLRAALLSPFSGANCLHPLIWNHTLLHPSPPGGVS